MNLIHQMKQGWKLIPSCLSLAALSTVAATAATCRVPLVLHGTGTAVQAAPVRVSGRAILERAGTEPVALASLRIAGPHGPLPFQCDECDGTGSPVAAPNHRLDADDEIVFQADLPAQGETTYWISWSAEPVPPAVFPSTLLVGAALEPAAFQHDFQLWNDRCLMGMRGPARSTEPTKNSIDNWGCGGVVLLEMFHRPVIRIGSSWASIFPRGAVASSPCADAARWSRPQLLVQGPVRVGARTMLTGGRLTAKIGGGADVEHRAWLYDAGALVCFEEILVLTEDASDLALNYEQDLFFGDTPGDRIWCMKAGVPLEYTATEDTIREARDKSKIVFQSAEFNPWLAGHSLRDGKGWALLPDAGALCPGEKRATVMFTRTGGCFRFQRTIPQLAKGTRLVQRFWITAWEGTPELLLPEALATWLAAGEPALGPVERSK